ncbi:MAG: helix-turn-helix transcriptional regulator [Pirellulales bacterium]|nr:helix-turn-helix transcriptional regulator [Pirellulales bacterium]
MKEKQREALSDQLRRLIEESPLTRAEISRRTGIAESTLCKLVQGERGISTDSWDALGECLNLRIVSDKRKGKGR